MNLAFENLTADDKESHMDAYRAGYNDFINQKYGNRLEKSQHKFYKKSPLEKSYVDGWAFALTNNVVRDSHV
jgi:hypothetical protein